jgi:hypothetical protein
MLALLLLVAGAAGTLVGANLFPGGFAKLTGHLMLPVADVATLIEHNIALERRLAKGRCGGPAAL